MSAVWMVVVCCALWLVWRFKGSFHVATRVAGSTGQLVALGFIGLGVYTIFNDALFNGLWLAFIGWFLQNAAASNLAASNMQQSLHLNCLLSKSQVCVNSRTSLSSSNRTFPKICIIPV